MNLSNTVESSPVESDKSNGVNTTSGANPFGDFTAMETSLGGEATQPLLKLLFHPSRPDPSKMPFKILGTHLKSSLRNVLKIFLIAKMRKRKGNKHMHMQTTPPPPPSKKKKN